MKWRLNYCDLFCSTGGPRIVRTADSNSVVHSSTRACQVCQKSSQPHLGILGIICLHAAEKQTDLTHEIQLSDLTCSLANQVLCGFTIARLTFWSQVFNFIVKLV